MKFYPKSPIDWDMLVILTITIGGFSFSAKKLMNDSYLVRTLSSYEASQTAGYSNELYDLGCLDTRLTPRFSSHRKEIRMRGKLCMGNKIRREAYELKVRNITSGQSATIFYVGSESAFLTDPLKIMAGKNEIVFEWVEQGSLKSLVAEVYN